MAAAGAPSRVIPAATKEHCPESHRVRTFSRAVSRLSHAALCMLKAGLALPFYRVYGVAVCGAHLNGIAVTVEGRAAEVAAAGRVPTGAGAKVSAAAGFAPAAADATHGFEAGKAAAEVDSEVEADSEAGVEAKVEAEAELPHDLSGGARVCISSTGWMPYLPYLPSSGAAAGRRGSRAADSSSLPVSSAGASCATASSAGASDSSTPPTPPQGLVFLLRCLQTDPRAVFLLAPQHQERLESMLPPSLAGRVGFLGPLNCFALRAMVLPSGSSSGSVSADLALASRAESAVDVTVAAFKFAEVAAAAGASGPATGAVLPAGMAASQLMIEFASPVALAAELPGPAGSTGSSTSSTSSSSSPSGASSSSGSSSSSVGSESAAAFITAVATVHRRLAGPEAPAPEAFRWASLASGVLRRLEAVNLKRLQRSSPPSDELGFGFESRTGPGPHAEPSVSASVPVGVGSTSAVFSAGSAATTRPAATAAVADCESDSELPVGGDGAAISCLTWPQHVVRLVDHSGVTLVTTPGGSFESESLLQALMRMPFAEDRIRMLHQLLPGMLRALVHCHARGIEHNDISFASFVLVPQADEAHGEGAGSFISPVEGTGSCVLPVEGTGSIGCGAHRAVLIGFGEATMQRCEPDSESHCRDGAVFIRASGNEGGAGSAGTACAGSGRESFGAWDVASLVLSCQEAAHPSWAGGKARRQFLAQVDEPDERRDGKIAKIARGLSAARAVQLMTA